jgi:hypothetical protein
MRQSDKCAGGPDERRDAPPARSDGLIRAACFACDCPGSNRPRGRPELVAQRTPRRTGSRKWPTVVATIDVVSVSELLVESHGSTGDHRLQGDPDILLSQPRVAGRRVRAFLSTRIGGTLVVEQSKGCQAMVHVNPQHLDESVLLDADVKALTTVPPLKPGGTPSTGIRCPNCRGDAASRVAAGSR